MKKGIDISYWQGNIDFSKVAKNVDFVILREGYRKTVDPKFMEYVNGMQENGIRLRRFIIFAIGNICGRSKRRSCSVYGKISRKQVLEKMLSFSLILNMNTVEKSCCPGSKARKIRVYPVHKGILHLCRVSGIYSGNLLES